MAQHSFHEEKKPTHVAILCPACGGGGSVSYVALRQARELSKRSRVTLVSNSFPSEASDYARLAQVSPPLFGFLRRLSHVPNELWFSRSVRRMALKIHATDPINVILCHSHVLAARAARRLKTDYGIPYCVFVHGDPFERPRGTYDWRLTRLYRACVRPAYQNANLILALSEEMVTGALRRYADPQSIMVVPNGIDIEDIRGTGSANYSSSGNAALRILFVGRLAPEKGVDVLLQACGKVKRSGLDFALTLVGEGPLEPSLRKLSENEEIEDVVSFAGRLPRKMLGELYLNSDIVCVPSRSEPFGIVVLEALAMGKPVLASRTGGITSIIDDGKNGILIPPEDPEALAEKIKMLAHDGKFRKILSTSARDSVYPRFSWERIGALLNEGIQRVAQESISKNPSRSPKFIDDCSESR